MKRHITALAMLATGAAALSLSACGGGGGGESAAQEPATGGGDAAKTIRIDATDFAFEPSTVEVSAPGTYTFIVANTGKAEHALEIEGPGVEEKTGTIAAGDEAELTVEITEAGEYEVYCPVGGHRDMGMEGTLTAKAS
jgi:uncharacterized cupredoxin-like copper-binding protein